MKGPYTYSVQNRGEADQHYRVSDGQDNRIATCYDEGNAQAICLRLEAGEACHKAVRYALDRVQTDADFRWFMLDTQTMRLMVQAEAKLLLEDEERCMARRREWLRKHEDPREAQVPMLRKRVERLQSVMEARGIPVSAEDAGGST